MQDLSKFSLPKNFRGRSAIYVQLWWIVDVIFFRPSPQIFYKWRRFLLRLFGAKIGKNVIIRPSVTVTYPWKVEIGDNSWIGDDVVLYSLGEIKIGRNTVISQKSYICAGTHDYKQEDFPILSKEVIIEDECWLATDVFIGPGVRIYEGTVVGARSSVFKDIPARKVCMGSPVEIIKDRV